MAKVLVNDSNLTNIANAIRGKNGETTTYKPSEMAAAISAISGGGSDIPESAFVVSGNCQYRFANGGWDWFINQYGNRITTNDINNITNMFQHCGVTSIPFEINCINKEISMQYIYGDCTNLTNISKINIKPIDIRQIFYNCYRLKTVPEDFADNWDWSYLESRTSSNKYSGYSDKVFYSCYSLRSFPMNIFKGNPYLCSNPYFYYGFYNCYALDELVNLPVIYTEATWTGNMFTYCFNNCDRLKNITFAKQNDGTPYTVSWKSQVIELDSNVGYIYSDIKNRLINYNSGITADKEVTDATTYAALKDDPDWFTCNVAYSRYNHDSAVATINSLPDTSAYLATAGGTNTIKFKGAAGSATDGGAINTLTEEEIAVATAKGWTVTLV